MNVVKVVCSSKEEALARVASHEGVLAWYGFDWIWNEEKQTKILTHYFITQE